MVEVSNAIVVDSSVFWLVLGGLASLGVTIVMFEVSRLFKLVAAVREVKDELAEIRRTLESLERDLDSTVDLMKDFNRDNVHDHGVLKTALTDHSRDNEHDFELVKERLSRLEIKADR